MELKAFKTLTLNYKGEMVSVKYEMKYLNGDKWAWTPEDETIINRCTEENTYNYRLKNNTLPQG